MTLFNPFDIVIVSLLYYLNRFAIIFQNARIHEIVFFLFLFVFNFVFEKNYQGPWNSMPYDD